MTLLVSGKLIGQSGEDFLPRRCVERHTTIVTTLDDLDHPEIALLAPVVYISPASGAGYVVGRGAVGLFHVYVLCCPGAAGARRDDLRNMRKGRRFGC